MFWDMVVSLGSVCTSRVDAWVVHIFSCVALSYLSFPNGARVFVTQLIRYAFPLLPCTVTARVLGGDSTGYRRYGVATQAVSIGLGLGFFSGAPVYWVGHVLLPQNVTAA